MILRMSGRGAWAAAVAGALASCAPEAATTPRVAARAQRPAETNAARAPEPPPQYVVGDPARPNALSVLPAGDDATGVALEGVRFVLRRSQVTASRDVAEAPIQGAWRVPARLGGGFLFRAKGALYASETFDGLLRPVVSLPAEVAAVFFGPKAALVRAESGERWMIEPATGKRLPIAPAGLLEVAALDDGRAAALVEGGQLLVTSDGGARWIDATPRLRAPATRVFVARAPSTHEETLWVETSAGALGLLAGGRLADFDALPAAEPPLTLRPKQPAWRDEEPPIRRAVRAGALARDGSALVVASGDLVQVDLVSGMVDVVAAGKLPPDATCVATRTPDDVVFTCGRSNGGAFVVSRALERAPAVEQTFQDAGRFVVSDDGGVLWTGACDKASSQPARRTVCVRAPGGGGWQQLDLDGATDGGAGPTYNVVRWIPRGDGGAIAVVSDVGGVSNAWGLVDARTGELHAWPTDALTPTLRNALQASDGRPSGTDLGRLADRGWTVTPQGTLRGWASLGSAIGAIEVGIDGSLQTSPFTFERIASAGPIALARMRDGRIWQTLDRGTTWSEVAAPPATRPGGWIDPHACSLVGCDLGQWYRLGWASTPPSPQPPPTTAPPAPRIERTPAPALSCRLVGDPKRKEVARDDRSPDDLGLGASRLAVSDPRGLTDFLRVVFARRITGAVRDTDASDDAAPRAIVHGPATQPGEVRLVVSGFNRDAMALVRQVAFVPAFDPLGTVRRAPVAMPDLLAAARSGGAPAGDVLRDDPVPSAAIPITPVDPSAPDDLLVQLANGGIALLRGSAQAGGRSSRFAYEAGRGDEWRVVSGAALDGDGFAWLEENASGRARAMRAGASGAPTTAFEIEPPPTADLYPANLDALAVGSRGELALLRTPSGGEPASPFDPAVIIVPGAPAAALAAWSTLTAADDPACKADASGWRATVQTFAPWIRLLGAADVRGADEGTMLARVRWSTTRVCLEAVELRTQDVSVVGARPSQWGTPWDAPVESWAVARFAGGAAAGRVVVVPGGELHQGMECKL
jgi:hypothetical protein